MTERRPTVEEILRQRGYYVSTTSGISMYPLLRDRQFVIKVVPAQGRLKKYDVALFHRGSELVLHRVIRVYPDRYYIRGDNCEGGEYVSDSQIIGVLSEINGKDRHLKVTDPSYIAYSHLTVLSHPVRYAVKKSYRLARRGARRILRGN